MRNDQIKDFFKELLRDLKNNAELPREIREEIRDAKEVAVQASEFFTIIQYETAEGVRKQFRYQQTRDGGTLTMQTSGLG